MFLQAKQTSEGSATWGVNGTTGELADMKDLGVWDTYAVKAQTIKTAIEVSFFLALFIRIVLLLYIIITSGEQLLFTLEYVILIFDLKMMIVRI